jgi:hypothetical protein
MDYLLLAERTKTMDIDERKVGEEIVHETYPYDYVQFTALKMRELDLESELGHASEAEKKPIVTGDNHKVRP